MCGRYAIVPTDSAWGSIGEILGRDVEVALAATRANYNVVPTQGVPIVVEDRETGEPKVIAARWGLIPGWWKQLKLPSNTINARSEDAANKPMWRHSWRHMRCLIPATHYYEWLQLESGAKLPHAFRLGENRGFMFAGLWSVWVDPATGIERPSCAILTRAAVPNIANIHDRMPIILDPSSWRRWIDRSLTDPDQVATLAIAAAIDGVVSYPVSSAVSSVRNNRPDLIDPLPDP
jgi:putative SOS response-associated peptidase YedK